MLGVLLLAVALLACGASAPERLESSSADYSSQAAPAPTAVPMAASAAVEDVYEVEVMKEITAEQAMAAAAAPDQEAAGPAGARGPVGSQGEPGEDSAQSVQVSFEQVARAAQNRIIVRTVTMSLVVADVAESVDRIAAVAVNFDGWVVSTDRSTGHEAFVAFRVPAQKLDDVVLQLRRLATKVDYETTNSQDVTDEYVDTESRLRSMEATEQSLLELLGRAGSVKDALEVQQSLAELQAEIEAMKGRIRYLQETSAFSLVSVKLKLSPAAIPVDAGPDQTFSVGQVARFRASFAPPPGLDDFTFTWDFGDGRGRVTGSGTAPKPEGDGRVTATVNHIYNDDRDSPFIVQLEIMGRGDNIRAEGSDTLIATVTRIPTIEVFTQEFREVEEGQEAEYVGSFTRPESLWDLQYRWDFGDGSPIVAGVPEAGVTRAAINHVFSDFRFRPYDVTLTVTAQSEAGEVKGSNSSIVLVTESRGLIIGGWSAGGTGKTAIRTLSVVAQGFGTLIIWLAIFSPVWLIGGGIVYLIVRLRRIWRQRNPVNGEPSRGRPQDPTTPETT